MPLHQGAQEDKTSSGSASGSLKVGAYKDSQLGQVPKSRMSAKRRTTASTPKLDLYDKRGLFLGHTDPSALQVGAHLMRMVPRRGFKLGS